jgi:hypothetical protein
MLENKGESLCRLAQPEADGNKLQEPVAWAHSVSGRQAG